MTRKHQPRIVLATILLLSLCMVPSLSAQSYAEDAGRGERFVSVGILRDHGTSRTGSQRYALFDAAGSIVAYVASRRDMDLSTYLDRQVGITAKAVSYGSGKTPFVLAERVTVLENTAQDGVGHVELAAFDDPLLLRETEVIPAGAEYIDSEVRTHIPSGPQSAGMVTGQEFVPVPHSGCNQCGHKCEKGGSCSGGSCAACPCGPQHRIWVRPEYLLWWTKGMDIPPLVTTSNVATTGAGALGVPGTSILYGNQDILEDMRSGFRLRAGMWLDRCQWWGVEADWFFLADESEQFARSSNGTPLLARPFFNMNPFRVDENLVLLADPPARQDAQLVAAPGILAGTVTVDSETSLSGFGLRGRFNVCCENYACESVCNSGILGSSRVDVLVGYRQMRLGDDLTIRESLNDLNPPGNLLTINEQIVDSFSTRNDFNGAEVGILWETHRRRWYMELVGKVALGNNRQRVNISGSTTRTFNGIAAPAENGGLLAQSSNIGSYERDEFAVIPELGATLGFHITPRLMLTGGYSFIYWSPVVRAGDQIDLDVNEELLPPPADPVVGAQRPRFAFVGTDFWAQGLNFGLDYRW